MGVVNMGHRCGLKSGCNVGGLFNMHSSQWIEICLEEYLWIQKSLVKKGKCLTCLGAFSSPDIIMFLCPMALCLAQSTCMCWFKF